MAELTCEQLRELAPELALGLVSGRSRAETLAHLNRCSACRAEVRELTAVGDALLALLPGAEPPAGFEDRVLARLPRPARRADRRRRLPVAVAAAVAAVVFGTGGWLLAEATHQSAPASAPAGPVLLTAALLGGDHDSIGQIWAYPGRPSWVYVAVDAGTSDRIAMVSCQLVRRDGTTVDVGVFGLAGGYGHWGAPAPVDPTQLRGARLIGPDGALVAAATF